MSNYLTYGQAFRVIQKRRQLLLKELSPELTISSISHFEHDGSDMGITKLATIMHGTYSTLNELDGLVTTQDDQLRTLLETVRTAYTTHDLPTIEQLQVQYQTSAKLPERLLSLLLSVILRDLAGHQTDLSADEQDLVSDYLLAPGPWLKF